MKKLSLAIIQNLTNFIKSFLSALLGVNEIMFLLGFGGMFYGISNQWSLNIALIVCGALLIAVAIGGIIVAGRRAE